MKNRRKMLERVSEIFELPGEVIADMPKFTVSGNRRMHIEGHKGILQYDRTLIAISAGSMILRVCGKTLEITSMSSEELLITGNIEKFEFEDSWGMT